MRVKVLLELRQSRYKTVNNFSMVAIFSVLLLPQTALFNRKQKGFEPRKILHAPLSGLKIETCLDWQYQSCETFHEPYADR